MNSSAGAGNYRRGSSKGEKVRSPFKQQMEECVKDLFKKCTRMYRSRTPYHFSIKMMDIIAHWAL